MRGAEVRAAVRELVVACSVGVVAMGQPTMLEAQASLARLEHVVEEARARFGEQDARFTAGLGELAHGLQAADTWAQAEPARIAAAVQAVPAAPWLGAARPSTPPRAAPAWHAILHTRRLRPPYALRSRLLAVAYQY